jgi:hypothetical protein
MKLTAYVIDGHALDIRPAPVDRGWMDATDQRYAYRCLPLSIANSCGWEILCAGGFKAVWNGGRSVDSVQVTPDDGSTAPALSHFGDGILTFHIPCLLRTAPGFDLMVMGPINRPKDAIAALCGIVETDWSPFSFTMNWLFTRQQTVVRFEKGEPICHFMTIRRGEIETVEPEFRLLSENPELKSQHEQWMASRNHFLDDLKRPQSEARTEKWQKRYHRGIDAAGAPAPINDHRTKLQVRPFKALTET